MIEVPVFGLHIHIPQFTDTVYQVRTTVGSMKISILFKGTDSVRKMGTPIIILGFTTGAMVKALILITHIDFSYFTPVTDSIGTTFRRVNEIIGFSGIILAGKMRAFGIPRLTAGSTEVFFMPLLHVYLC